MVLEVDSKFAGRYILKKQLGRGGFSEVWLAQDSMSGLYVAVKIYAPYGGLDANDASVFGDEFSLVFNINHTNLLKPTYYDSFEGSPYLILPFCSNGSATKLMGKIDERTLVNLIHDVAAGLAYLHSQEPPVIHQDIKPDNILINDHGDFVITDFGISTKIRSTLRKSASNKNFTSGTIAYMGAERFSAHPMPVKASDIWSLGATAFELAEGYPPFGEIGGGMQKNGAEIPEMTANISQEVKDLIRACLAQEPWSRPTAAKLVEWTNAIRRGEPEPENLLPNRPQAGTPQGQNRRNQKPQDQEPEKKGILSKWWFWAAAGAAVVALLLVLLLPGKKTAPVDEEEVIAEKPEPKPKRQPKAKPEPVLAVTYIETKPERTMDVINDTIKGVEQPNKKKDTIHRADTIRRSYGYVVKQAYDGLADCNGKEAAAACIAQLEKLASQNAYPAATADAYARLAYIYSRKPSADKIGEYIKSSFSKYLKDWESFKDVVEPDPTKAHDYAIKAIEKDKNCYKAYFELMLDYWLGDNVHNPNNRGACATDKDEEAKYREQGLKAASDAKDALYRQLFEARDKYVKK